MSLTEIGNSGKESDSQEIIGHLVLGMWSLRCFWDIQEEISRRWIYEHWKVNKAGWSHTFKSHMWWWNHEYGWDHIQLHSKKGTWTLWVGQRKMSPKMRKKKGMAFLFVFWSHTHKKFSFLKFWFKPVALECSEAFQIRPIHWNYTSIKGKATFRNYLENSQYLSLCAFKVHQYTKSYHSQNIDDSAYHSVLKVLSFSHFWASLYAVLPALSFSEDFPDFPRLG